MAGFNSNKQYNLFAVIDNKYLSDQYDSEYIPVDMQLDQSGYDMDKMQARVSRARLNPHLAKNGLTVNYSRQQVIKMLNLSDKSQYQNKKHKIIAMKGNLLTTPRGEVVVNTSSNLQSSDYLHDTDVNLHFLKSQAVTKLARSIFVKDQAAIKKQRTNVHPEKAADLPSMENSDRTIRQIHDLTKQELGKVKPVPEKAKKPVLDKTKIYKIEPDDFDYGAWLKKKLAKADLPSLADEVPAVKNNDAQKSL